MSRREEILAELGLTPIWRLREQPGAAQAREPLDPEMDRAQVASEPDAGPGIASEAIDIVAPVNPADRTSVGSMGWVELRQAVSSCTGCVLHEKRKQAVLGVGDERADWLIVGEGPGAEEDARGEPFVGQAGKLLDNMLSAIGLARGKNVYIANVVKCRPPGNRTPSTDEADSCAPFLDRQIALLQPRLIVALGKAAAHRLLGRDGTLASMRSNLHEYRGIPLIVTYHPAYLLRNMTDKRKTWEDLCLAVDTMAGLAKSEDQQK